MPFSGVLTLLDVPSNKAPHGSQGKRVIMTTAAATKALPSLLGMAVNYLESQDGHSVNAKVGLITGAVIEGKAIKIDGFIYARDHPQAAAKIRANKRRLGFSYELADIYAAEAGDCWGITDCVFTGAAILLKDKAAYHGTSLEASADGETDMTKEEMASAIAESLGLALKPVTEQLTAIQAANEANTTAIAAIQAGAAADKEKTALEIAQAEAASLKTQLADLKAAAEKTAEPERKTLSPQFANILARADITLPGAGGEKLSIGAVDAALSKTDLTPVKRMEIKNELQRAGAL
jgi:hypothetical protein